MTHCHATNSSITIRHSRDADRAAILRLAALDSRPAPDGHSLLAFEGCELRAALPLNGGSAIADPFERTAEIVDLLRVRAAQEQRGPLDRSIAARALAVLRLSTA